MPFRLSNSNMQTALCLVLFTACELPNTFAQSFITESAFYIYLLFFLQYTITRLFYLSYHKLVI